MDLSRLDTRERAETGEKMTVENPATGETVKDDAGNPVTITLLGNDSTAMRRRQNDLTNEILKKGFRPKSITAEKTEENRLETLAIATIAWSGIELDGQVLECTRENAVKLYTRLPWLRDQADAFVGDRANFIKA